MKILVLFLVGVMLMSGCAGSKSSNDKFTFKTSGNVPAPTKPANDKHILTPQTSEAGKVVSVNANSRFVVLNYPIGALPAIGQRLNVYRSGLKVGELKVSGPQKDENTIADITTGEIQAGDESRAN